MGKFIYYVIIIFGIYFICRAIIRGIVSWYLGDDDKKIEDQLRRQKEEMVKQKKKQEGRVTINYQPKAKKSIQKDEGDYVDFEEVN